MEPNSITSAPLKYFGGYVCLPLELKLAEQITFDGMTYYAKSEYHCSLICVKCIMAELVENHGREGGPLQRQVLHEIETARQQSEPVFLGYINELRHVSKTDNQSIVIMVNVAKLEPIFKHLRSKYEITIPLQPTHVTLYSLISNKGIGIPTLQDTEATQIIQGAALKELKGAINFENVFGEELI